MTLAEAIADYNVKVTAFNQAIKGTDAAAIAAARQAVADQRAVVDAARTPAASIYDFVTK